VGIYSQLTRDLLARFRDSIQFSLKNIYDVSAERKHDMEALKKSERLHAETEEIGKVGGWVTCPPKTGPVFMLGF